MAYNYGSNYPPSGGGYGGYASGGPPPPPGGGYSAYNTGGYPSYAAGGGYGGSPYAPPGGGYGAPPPSGYGYPGAYPTYGQGAVPGFTSPAVPGFTAPAVQHAQQGWGGCGGNAPAQMQVPSSMQYGHMQNAMANHSMQSMQWENYKKMGLISMSDEEEEMEEEKRRRRRRRRRKFEEDEEEEERDEEADKAKYEERARRAEEKAKELQEKLQSNDSLKDDLRERFISELMRRQDCNGTFEETQGTVFPMTEYDEEDPVSVWYGGERDPPVEILGEKWDPLYDAEFLRKAMHGLGTDEDAITGFVVNRSIGQRNRILKEYKTSYGRDLIEDLKSELSGDYKDAILATFESPARYDAYSVKKAIYGLGTNEGALIEVLMTRTNAQIQEMVQEYDKITYGKQKDPDSSIEKDIEGDTSGDFKRLLISACQGNRRLFDRDQLAEAVEEVVANDQWTGMFRVNYDNLCNLKKCKRMAQELFDSGEDKWGTDEETFNRIFSTQDYYTLRVVWDQYVKISQRDILNSVERETSGSLKQGLCAIAQNIKCRPMYFAERLYKSMKGLGTDDATLIRIVASRSQMDMVQIKACFLEKYKQTLWNFIKDDSSGDYRKLLCGIVGRD